MWRWSAAEPRPWQLAGRIIASLLTVALIAIAVHSWPVREYVRHVVAARATQFTGAVVDIGHLHYDLATLSFVADNLTISAAGRDVDVRVFVPRAALHLSWRALRAGRIELDNLFVPNAETEVASHDHDRRVTLRGVRFSMDREGGKGLVGRLAVRGPATVFIGSVTRHFAELGGTIRLDGESVHVEEARASSGEMKLTISGTINDLFADVPTALLRGTWQATAQDVCSPELPWAVSCRQVAKLGLSGRISLDGKLSSPTLRVDVDGDGATVTAVPFSIRGAAVLSQQTLNISQVELHALGGRATLDGTVRFEDRSRQTTTTLEWQEIDVPALAGLLDVTVPFAAVCHGRAVITGDPSKPATLSAEASMRLLPAPVRTVKAGTGISRASLATTADVSMRLHNGRWSARVFSGRIGAASVHGEITGSIAEVAADARTGAPIAGALHVNATDVDGLVRTLNQLGLDVAPPRLDKWQTDVAADFQLSGTLEKPRVTGKVVAQASASDLSSATAAADVSIGREGIDVSALRVIHGLDRLDGALRYRSDTGAIDGQFNVAIDLADLSRTLGNTPWTVQGRATGSAWLTGTIESPQGEANLHAADVALQRPEVEGILDAGQIILGVVELNITSDDRVWFRLALPDRHVTATGSLALTPDRPFDASIQMRDVDVTALVGQSLGKRRMSARLDGDASLRGSLLHWGETELDLQLARVDASLDDVPIALAAPARVHVASRQIADAAIGVQVGSLTARVMRFGADEPLQFSVDGSLPAGLTAWQEGPPAIAIEGRVDQSVIDVPHASVRGRDFSARATASVPLSFVDEWLPVSWRSVPAAAPPANAHVEARAFPVAMLIDRLVPAALGLDGRVDIVMQASAARPSLEALRVDGRIDGGTLEVAGVHLAQQGAAVVTLDSRVLSLTDCRWTGTGAELTLRAASTLSDNDPRYDMALTGHVDLATAITRADDHLTGNARIDMTMSGSRGAATWSGSAEVSDGSWVSPRQALAISDIEARVTCDGVRCRLESSEAQVNGGTLALSGQLPLPGASADARIEAVLRGVVFEIPRGTGHDFDADLTLAGGDTPQLTGTVTLWPATVSESLVGLAQLAATLRAAPPIDPRPDVVSQTLRAIALDVQIVSGDDLVFNSPDVNVAATADLRVRGTLAAPQLRGELAALDQGRLFLAGREWRLEEGTVSLSDAAAATNIRLSATLTARISRYAVSIKLAGPASRPAVVMSADPPLSQSDLASLVMTGTTSSSLDRSAQHVAGVVSTDLLTNVGRVLGMDAVRIEQAQSELSSADLEPVSRLTVSKKLTDRFEVVYSQALNEEDDLAWVLVWKPGWQALDLRATIRTNGAEAYEIRQELEFGAPPNRRTRVATRQAAPLVARVDVVGVGADEAAAILRRISLAEGSAFTSTAWQRDRQAVANYFHERDRLRVRVRSSHAIAADGRYVLTYQLTPGPTTRLSVRGYTIDDETRSALADAWSRASSQQLVTASLNEALRLSLATDGYLRAEVNTTLTEPTVGDQLASIVVDAGTRSTRRSVTFDGNQSVVEADLRRALTTAQVEPRAWLDPSVVKAPLEALYRMRGFLAARVDASQVVDGDRATLRVGIDEGRPYTIGTLAFTGVSVLDERRARDSFGLDTGAPFTNAAVSAAAAKLGEAYARSGYLGATVDWTVSVQDDRQAVDLAVVVSEGPVSVLNSVRVNGAGATSPKLVSQMLGITAGGTVDRQVLDQAQQRLYETGIFRTVDIDLTPSAGATATPLAVDALVALEERPKYRLRYGVQFGPTTLDNVTTENNSAEPGATIDLQRRNLFGLGITAGGGGVWSASQHRIRATASAATLAGRFVSTTFTIEHANEDRQSDKYGIDIVDRSLRAVLEQRWRRRATPRMEFAYGFDVDHRRLELLATAAEPLPLRARVADLNATFVYDTRDSFFSPKRGLFHTSRIEAGAGAWLSDIPFVRYQLQQFFYFPAGRTTLASGVRFGSLHADTVAQPSSLLLFFHTGGSNSVRGYEDDSLTPGYVIGVPAGGKALLVLNQEVRVPIWRRLGAVGFADLGNTFEELTALRLRSLKVAAGAGVRFETAVAVLRLDVGLPLPPLPGQPRARWYLSIGHAF